MSDELTEKIIGAAIEVHRILGPGLLDAIYEEALCVESVAYSRAASTACWALRPGRKP